MCAMDEGAGRDEGTIGSIVIAEIGAGASSAFSSPSNIIAA